MQPGRPDVAGELAIEDAMVDHGNGEGTVAAAFVATMQSSAFVLKDIKECINLALSKIPEKSRVYKTVKFAIDCYNKKVDVREARDKIFKLNEDIGDGWFEAPSNVGYAVLGLLYGEGDFKKSMIYAINCGDDTDCTGATVGATLGILGGTKAIPNDWKKHIGDDIVTISIDKGTLQTVPKTCTELTERVAKLSKCAILTDNYPLHRKEYQPIEFTDGKSEIEKNCFELLKKCDRVLVKLNELQPYSVTEDFLYARATAFLDDVNVKPLETRKIRIKFIINIEVCGNIPYKLNLRWWLPEGFMVKGPKCITLPQWDSCPVYYDFEITAGEKLDAINRAVLEIMADSRMTAGYLPIVLLG